MDLASGIAVFFLIWWLVLFMVLPWGVRNPHEAGEKATRGSMPGAPVKAMMWRKLLATTLISIVVFAIVWWLIRSDLFSFHGMTWK